MRYFISILFLAFHVCCFSQTNSLFLHEGLDKLAINKTTVKEARQLFGKPEKSEEHCINANLGSYCLRFFFTTLYYKNFNLTFSSEDSKHRNKRILGSISISSSLFINNTLKIGVSDSMAVKALFGEKKSGDWEEDQCRWNYELKYGGKSSIIYFYFNTSGILAQVLIRDVL